MRNPMLFSGFNIPPGCAVWVEADSGLLVLDGSNGVATWSDQSGNARHFTQTNASYRPVWTPNILNGHPAIKFNDDHPDRLDGVAAALNLIQNTSGATFITVFKIVGATAVAQTLFDATIGTSVMMNVTPTPLLTAIGTVGRRVQADTADNPYKSVALTNVPYIFTVTANYASAEYTCYGNGSQGTSPGFDSAGNSEDTALTLCRIGGSRSLTGPCDGYIAAFGAWRRVLATGERQYLERWLGWKYGIVVA